MADIFDQLKPDIFDQIQPQQAQVSPRQGILSTGVEGAKAAARGIFGEGISQFIDPIMSPTTAKSVEASQNIADEATSQVPREPHLGLLNPHSVTNAIARGVVDPRSLATSMVGGLRPFRPKNFGKLARRLADVSSKSVKELREIGPGNVFKPEVEAQDFVGKVLAPRASTKIEKSLQSLDPETLKAVGVKPNVLDDIAKVKTEYGLNELPSRSEADKFFEDVVKQDPFNGTIEPSGFKVEARKAISSLESGLGRENSITKALRGMLDKLESTPSITQAVESGTGAGPVSNSLSKETYLGTRQQLNGLFNGNPYIDKLVQRVKVALDKDAAVSGITGISRARNIYRVSREADKVRTYLSNPKRLEAISSKLLSGQDPKNFQVRETLKKLLGSDYDQIAKELTSNRLAQEFSPRGLYSSRAGIVRGTARAGLRAYEESVRPTLLKLLRRK